MRNWKQQEASKKQKHEKGGDKLARREIVPASSGGVREVVQDEDDGGHEDVGSGNETICVNLKNFFQVGVDEIDVRRWICIIGEKEPLEKIDDRGERSEEEENEDWN